jgi:threonyl-tRNA synthetase
MHNNDPKLMAKRHTLAHLLAAAVLEHYPEAKPTIGPAIDNGFYYDFEFPADKKPTDDDLKSIEKSMRKILPHWKTIVGKEVQPDEAKKIFSSNKYKLELIDEIVAKKEPVTLYTAGGDSNKQKPITNNQSSHSGFTDLCRGGHSDSPAEEILADSFRLTHIAGAYWRGNENNTMLTRIYGLAFHSGKELDEYEKMMAEAEKRDHRKLGKEMSIFCFDDDVGPGLPLWLPNGGAIIEELEKLAKETEFKMNYERVHTPHIAKDSMYLRSGHLPYYEDSMFPPMQYEGGKYYMKAMNCPHHHKIFAAEPRSYRQLPLRLAEYGMCYRHEKSGELFGLMRVRAMLMNDAHIYCKASHSAQHLDALLQFQPSSLAATRYYVFDVHD